MSGDEASLERGDYCRRVEAYLCRKNEGHLIRIVGPSFDVVCSWADRGVPFAIVCQGIDRYVERQGAKGGRRRPVQIQFCEADVLDLFDNWRRAVGISESARSQGGVESSDSGHESQRRGSLGAHLERVIARLTNQRGAGAIADELIDTLVRELDRARAAAKSMRGAARERFLDRLRDIDQELLAAARQRVLPSDATALEQEAGRELAPFRDRLPADAYARALHATQDRLLRERTRLPQVAFD